MPNRRIPQVPPAGLVPKPVPTAPTYNPTADWTVAQLDEWAKDDAGYPSNANKAEKQAYLGITTEED